MLALHERRALKSARLEWLCKFLKLEQFTLCWYLELASYWGRSGFSGLSRASEPEWRN